MNLGPQDSSVRDSRELVPFRTLSTKTFVASWKKSPSLRSPSPSALTLHPPPLRPVVVRSCSLLHTFRTRLSSLLLSVV